MNIFWWNIRSLNQSHKQEAKRNKIDTLQLDLFGVIENKVRAVNYDSVYNKCFPTLYCVHNICIRHYRPRNTMQPHYLCKEQVGYVRCIISFTTSNEMCHLKKSIYDYIDGIIAPLRPR